MRRTQRLVAAVVLMALSGALAGCSSFDPTDMFDWLDTKKKLPGDRKPVFPEGVPGLEQGVPKELYKGAQQPDTQNPDVAAAPPAAPVEPAPKGKVKGKKSKATATAAAPAEVNGEAAPEEEAPPAVPAPKAKKIARKRTTAPPPDAGEAPPEAAPQQPAQAFPAPLPSGSFSR